jgi:hypothetical protein
MNKALFHKAAALACSLATLSVLGITASAQTPVPDDKDIDTMTDLVDGKINIIAGVIQAQPGETVKYPVYIANNAESGFSAVGLRLFYDAKLTPATGKDGKLVVDKRCTAGDDLVKSFSLNTEKKVIGLGSMGSEPEKDNGLLYTVEIKVPKTAKEGDIYTMSLEIDKWLDGETNPIDCVTFDGCIYVGSLTEQKQDEKEPKEPKEPKDPKGPKAHKEPKGPKDKKDKKPAQTKQTDDIYSLFHNSSEGEIHFYWYEDGTWQMSASGKRP